MVIPAGAGQVNWAFGGVPLPNGAEVTMGFALTGFSGTAQDAADALYTIWSDNILPVQTNLLVLLQARVKFGPDATGPSAEANGTDAGSLATDSVTPNTALLVQKITAAGGRAGRGRMFVPGLGEVDVSGGGTIDSAYRAAAQTAFDDLLADMTTANLPAVLLHGADSPLTSPNEITSLSVSGTAATQRQRLRR